MVTYGQVADNDLVTIRGFVLDDTVALKKWGQVVDHIVLRAYDAVQIKTWLRDDNGRGADAILNSLRHWNGYETGKRKDLLEVLRKAGLNSLVDRIIANVKFHYPAAGAEGATSLQEAPSTTLTTQAICKRGSSEESEKLLKGIDGKAADPLKGRQDKLSAVWVPEDETGRTRPDSQTKRGTTPTSTFSTACLMLAAWGIGGLLLLFSSLFFYGSLELLARCGSLEDEGEFCRRAVVISFTAPAVLGILASILNAGISTYVCVRDESPLWVMVFPFATALPLNIIGVVLHFWGRPHSVKLKIFDTTSGDPLTAFVHITRYTNRDHNWLANTCLVLSVLECAIPVFIVCWAMLRHFIR